MAISHTIFDDVSEQLKRLLKPGVAMTNSKKDPAAAELAQPRYEIDISHPVWKASPDVTRLLWVCRFGEGWVSYQQVWQAGPDFVQIFLRFRASEMVYVRPDWETNEHKVRLRYGEPQ